MRYLYAITLLVWTVGGCASWNLTNPIAFWDAPPKPQVPTRMIEFWSEEVLTTPGMPSVRGFAGRVMFYNDKQSEPIAVDGTFTVFAFEDTDRNNSYTAPEKKFVYLPDQLPKYYSKSELGRSYSLWIPWDEVGGPERKLCLISRFEPRKGPPVVPGRATNCCPARHPSRSAGKPGDEPEQRRAVRRCPASVLRGTLSPDVENCPDSHHHHRRTPRFRATCKPAC